MNRSTTFALLLSAAALLSAGVASADRPNRVRPKQVRPPVTTSFTEQSLLRIQRTEQAQLKRLSAGMRDGSLTFREAGQVTRKMDQVTRRLKSYLRDRRLKPREVRRLEAMQTQVTRTIRKLRQNRVARFGYRPAVVVRPVPRPNPIAPRPPVYKRPSIKPPKLKGNLVPKARKGMVPAHVSL